MKYKVLGERVLVRRDAPEEDGHILMPHNVKKKPKTGIILSVGPKVTEEVKVGNRVVFNEFAGYFLETSQDFEESDLIVMRQDEILAVEAPDTEGDK